MKSRAKTAARFAFIPSRMIGPMAIPSTGMKAGIPNRIAHYGAITTMTTIVTPVIAMETSAAPSTRLIDHDRSCSQSQTDVPATTGSITRKSPHRMRIPTIPVLPSTAARTVLSGGTIENLLASSGTNFPIIAVRAKVVNSNYWSASPTIKRTAIVRASAEVIDSDERDSSRLSHWSTRNHRMQRVMPTAATMTNIDIFCGNSAVPVAKTAKAANRRSSVEKK